MAKLIGNETWSNKEITSQVYQATHDGAGKRLPYMSRSFISFTFGGKVIEDFGLIVVNLNDRMERKAYTEFSDLTSTYDVLNGQLYWGSNLSANNLELDLATDGITERQIDDFREWFSPGKERELILSEHPNRAILARIESVPVLSFLPFEKKTTLKIAGSAFETSTTLYKGEVKLSFVMDEPRWHAKLRYMPSYVNKVSLARLDASSTNSNKVETLKDKDMLKIILEDGIPHQYGLINNIFLGDNKTLLTTETRTDSAITSQSSLGISVATSSAGVLLNNTTPQYLFYSGTASSQPIIKFSMKPIMDANDYISSPKNKIQNPELEEFSTITIEDENFGDKIFQFTTPGILTGYNQAIKIFSNSLNKTPTEVLNLIREQINEQYSRAWAVACLNALNISSLLTSQNLITLKNNMKKFVNFNAPIVFSVNSKTGEATATFSIKILNSATDTINKTTFSNIKQNVGDMIRSDYLVIEGRNYLDSNGGIVLESKSGYKKISSNENLTDFSISFDVMYW